MNPFNLKSKFELFDSHWTPHIVAELNGQYVKVAKLIGEFVWHDHANEDELFYIVKGSLAMQFRDKTVTLNEGDMGIVPRGVEHNPVAEEETWVMLLEPKETKHTGDVAHEKTINDQKWI